MIEDVNESVYRIDRMLTQLRLSGALQIVAGIAFGQFTEIPEDPANLDAPALGRARRGGASARTVPCLANVPVGHIADQWTLPLGAVAELDADSKTLIGPTVTT